MSNRPPPVKITVNKLYSKCIEYQKVYVSRYQLPNHPLSRLLQARLHWPRLTSSSSRTVDFETTQVGNVSTRELLLENPGDSPVLVQVLTLPQYPNPIAMKDMIGSRIELTNEDLDNLELKDLDIFTLQRWWNVGGGGSGGGSGGSSSGGSSNGGVNVEKQRLEDQFGIRPHNKTAAFVLHPGEKYRVRLSFAPKDDTKKSSIVLIRNNLTIVEAVVLKVRIFSEIKSLLDKLT